MNSVAELKPGECGVICAINDTSDDASYLMELGLMEGTSIRLIKEAPLGDPLELDVRGYHLSIRRRNAECIMVERG